MEERVREQIVDKLNTCVCVGWDIAEKAGIKKVVDWIKFNCLPQPQPFEGKGEQTGYYVDFKDLEKEEKWNLEQ